MAALLSSISKGFQTFQQKVSEDASLLNEKFQRTTTEAFDPGDTLILFLQTEED